MSGSADRSEQKKHAVSDRAADSRPFFMALGVLIFCIITFVALLSRLPVDHRVDATIESVLAGAELQGMHFDYYTQLPEQKGAWRERIVRAPDPEPMIVIPASARDTVTDTPPVATSQPVERIVVTPAPVTVQAPEVVPEPRPAEALALRSPAEPAAIALDSYFLEVGSYRLDEQAERARAALSDIGVSAFIVARPDDTGMIGYRVRIGPFFKQPDLDRVRDRLRTHSIAHYLIRVRA